MVDTSTPETIAAARAEEEKRQERRRQRKLEAQRARQARRSRRKYRAQRRNEYRDQRARVPLRENRPPFPWKCPLEVRRVHYPLVIRPINCCARLQAIRNEPSLSVYFGEKENQMLAGARGMAMAKPVIRK